MNQLAFEGFEPDEEKQAPQKEKREPTKINLYWCYDAGFGDKRIGVWVFATTPNKARWMYVEAFFFPPYGDYYPRVRAMRYKEDVGGEPEVCDYDCERLAKLGYTGRGME